MAKENDLLFDKPTLVDGGQTKDAVVVTNPGKQHVNAPTVEDIQRIAKGIAEKEAEAASATEWEKSVKDHLYEEDGYVVARSTYGLSIVVTDINRGLTIGTDTNNDTLTFDFGYLQLGYSDRSDMYIDVDEQEIGCESVRCKHITNSETDGVVYAENLLDGNRVYKHTIRIEGTILSSTAYIYFSIWNSNPTPFESFDELEDAEGQFVYVQVFVILGNVPYSGAIEYVNNGEFTMLLTDGNETTLLGTNATSIIDDVTQC